MEKFHTTSLVDIPTVVPLHSKPEIALQYIWEFMRATKQVKPETPQSMATFAFITTVIYKVVLQVCYILYV